MNNPQKIKGSKWERDLVKLLLPHAESARRIPGSGALGTALGEARLTGDAVVKYKFYPHPIKIEAKCGYGGATQMTVKRLWMEKIRMEAAQNGSLPAVSIKFMDVLSGDKESAKWICFTIEDWNKLAAHLNELFEDMDEYWDYKYSQKGKK